MNSSKSKWYEEDLWETVKRLWSKIPSNLKLSMTASYIFGLAAHMFVYTNVLFVNDNAAVSYEKQGLLKSFLESLVGARWLQGILLELFGRIQMPWLIGLLTLFIYGFSAYFTCEYLGVRRSISIVLITGMMVTSPTTTASNTVLRGSWVLALALLSASMAVYLFQKGKHPYIWCFLLLQCCSGIYASYLSWAAGLFLIDRICNMIVHGERPFREEMKSHFSMMFMIISAYGLNYALIALVNLSRHDVLIDRVQTASSRGFFGFLYKIGWGVARTVAFFVYHDGRNSYFLHEPLLLLFFWAGFIVSAAVGIMFLQRKAKERGKAMIFLIVFDICILPLAMDTIGMFADFVHTLMSYAFLIPWILFVVIHDNTINTELLKNKNQKTGLYSLIIYGLSVVTVFSGIHLANVTYMKSYEISNSGMMLANRIVDRVESVEGYEPGVTPVYFVGDLRDYYSKERKDYELVVNMYGIGSPFFDASIIYDVPFIALIDQHLGITMKYAVKPVFSRNTGEGYAEILNQAGYQVDPVQFARDLETVHSFPAKDCYFWSDDVLVMKFETEAKE